MINFIILMWTYFDEIRALSNKNENYIYYIENIFILLIFCSYIFYMTFFWTVPFCLETCSCVGVFIYF